MKITKPLGRLDENSEETKLIDYVELEWEELGKRILRKKSNNGEDIAIALEEEIYLHPGDILFENENKKIVINTVLEDAIIIYPASVEEMGRAAFELGNRHTPCLIQNQEIIVRYDSTIPPLLKDINVTFANEKRRFNQPFKYKGHSHTHEH